MRIAAAAGAAISAAAHAQPQFFEREQVLGVNDIFGITAIDMNGDGLPDYVAVIQDNTFDRFLNVYLNDGNATPSFPLHLSLPSGVALRGALVGDLDGDGDYDIVHRTPAGELQLLTNDGAASPVFTPTTIAPPGSAESPFSLVDLNPADGLNRLDIVTAGGFGDGEWFQNLGGSPATFQVRPMPMAVTSDSSERFPADINNDGNTDLVVNENQWLQSSGGVVPTFTLENFPPFGRLVFHREDFAVGDIDGDGDDDVLLIQSEHNYFYNNEEYNLTWLYMLQNDGATPPTLTPTTIFQFQPTAGPASILILGDLDGDSDVDLLVGGYENDSNSSTSQLLWLDHDGSLGFSQVLIDGEADGLTALQIVDLDGDGDTDLSAPIGRADSSIIRQTPVRLSYHQRLNPVENLNSGQSFSSFADATYAASPGDVLMTGPARFEVDNQIDLSSVPLVVASTGDAFQPLDGSWILSGGSSIVSGGQDDVRLFGSTTVASGTATIDGGGEIELGGRLTLTPGTTLEALADCVFDAPRPEAVSLIDQGDGEPFNPPFLPLDQGQLIGASDLDLDGDDDLIITDGLALHVYESDGQSPPGFTPYTLPQCSLVVADVSGDGIDDFVVGNRYGGNDGYACTGNTLQVLINDGSMPPVPVAVPVGGVGDPSANPITADLDGDGDLDIVARDGQNGPSGAWYENPGGGIGVWTKHALPNGISLTRFAVGDLDGDGANDIITPSEFLRNDGGSPPSFQVDAVTFDQPLFADGNIEDVKFETDFLTVGDIDRDGDNDLVPLYTANADGRWFENTGDAYLTFVARTFAPVADAAAVVDFDGDGDLDIVGGVPSGVQNPSSIVAWFENDGEQPAKFSVRTLSESDPIGLHTLAVGDFDEDGDLDVAAARSIYYECQGYGGCGYTLQVITTEELVPLTLMGFGTELAVDGTFTIQRGEVAVGDDTTLCSTGGTDVAGALSTLSGSGGVVGDVTNRGTIRPASGQTLGVTGNLMQDGGRIEASLEDIGGPTTSAIAASGSVALDGSLVIRVDPSFDAVADQAANLSVLSAGAGVTGVFDIAYVRPALTNGRFLTVDYPSSLGPGGSVTLAVGQLAEPVDYGDPNVFTTNGTPSAAALGDLNNDGFPDLAVTVPDSADPINNPGQLVILLNDGTTGSLWDGFQNPQAQLILTTGNNPRGVAIGNLDDSGGLDLAVSNASSDNVQVFTSDGLALPNVALADTLDTGAGSEPTDIAIAELDGDASFRNDILVALTGADGVRIYENQGGISFITCDIPVEPRPNSVDPFDDDDDGRADVFAVGHDDPVEPSVSVVFALGGGSFSPPVNTPITDVPREVELEDFNNDGLPDVVSANPGGDSVTVILAQTASTFRPPVDLPVGENPTSVTVLDADEDGDIDLAIVATNEAMERVVQIIRNDTVTMGQLVFAAAEDLSANGTPALVLAGDVDQDSRDDIVTVNDESGSPFGPSSDVSVLLSQTTGDCPGDLTTTGGGAPGVPDGVTDLADLLFFVNAWDADLGSSTPNPGSIADTTTTGGSNPGVPDGDVDLSDLLYFVNEWMSGVAACP